MKTGDKVRVNGYYGQATISNISGKFARVQFQGRFNFSITVSITKVHPVK